MARVSVQVPIDPTEDPRAALPDTVGSTDPNVRQLATKGNLAIVAVAILVLIVIFMLFSLLNDRKQLKQQVNKLSTTQAASPQADAQKYQEAVSKLVTVPAGVTPTIKSPTEAEIGQLSKDNSLYKTSKSGDVFLLYTNPDKSLFLVIYRPSDQKVVLAALASQQSTAPAAPNTKQ